MNFGEGKDVFILCFAFNYVSVTNINLILLSSLQAAESGYFDIHQRQADYVHSDQVKNLKKHHVIIYLKQLCTVHDFNDLNYLLTALGTFYCSSSLSCIPGPEFL